MSTAPNPVVGMVNDPDFQKLQLSDQKRALAGVDKQFGTLSDGDFTRVTGSLKTPVIPGAPNGLPPVPTATSQVQMQPSNLAFAAGAPKMGLESGLPSPAQVPTNVGPMQTGAVIGSAIVNPIGTAGTLAGGYLGGKTARYGAQTAGLGEKGQNIAEAAGNVAGGIGGGSLGAMADAPLMKWLTSSKTVGAQLLQQASAKAGNAPVELSPKTNELVEKIATQSKLGGKMPKVISDLLERVGPSTKVPAEAPANPLTYDEARILQSNASQLSTDEAMQFKGSLKGLLKQFAGSFSNDVQAAADQAGIGTEHAAGMREYAMASARNRALAKAGKYGGAAAGTAALGAAGYAGFNAAKDVLGTK